jgi:hypothetical protein
MKSAPYASAVGSLMYAQVCTRPDLAFVTRMLDRYQKNTGINHWNGIKKALRYIQGTKGLMLTYERSDSLEIVGYSDSDFVGYLDTDRSTSDYVFKLAGGAISWSSSKQTVITSSTMYAEFVACYKVVGQTMWLKKFVPDLRVVNSIERPLKLYYDNELAVLYAHNNKKIKANKHINIRFYVVKEKIQDDYGSTYEGLTTQCVQRTLSRHGFEEKPVILDIKGSRQESDLKQKGVSWSLCLIVRN